MSEEDIKRLFITPAIEAKWDKHFITMETQITDGRISLDGNKATRKEAKKADYILYHTNKDHPIAIVEAKSNNCLPSFGMQQAISYSKMLDVPFAFSSNGDCFVEHDFLTGEEREIPLEDFPSLEALLSRLNNKREPCETQIEMESIPFYSDSKTYPPRYYQTIAINRTIDAIAKGQKRLLLVMATGTGKTYTAFQIVYKLLQSKKVKKVLYLADRNVLVDQTLAQDFIPLAKVAHKVNFNKDDKKRYGSYQVFFSLYQQLTERGEEEGTLDKIKSAFPPDYFDFVIVDECHRGSARENSNWRAVLEYFSPAIQLGMTATPKETNDVSNSNYFGKPIYSYSLRQGIEDGFLAPFKVIKVTLNIADGWRPLPDQRDINGEEIEDRTYNNKDYDYNIVIQDRIDQVASQITEYLKATDRMNKTIVFCPTEDAAERMRIALNNFNADKVKENPDYVVRITGSDEWGKKKLDYFISTNEKYPVIATTSKLLSTGVDAKMVKLIVLDEMISSMTEFKQIIGRGTRINEKAGKTHFTILDFRNVTSLFSDPDWDGTVDVDDNFDPTKEPKKPPKNRPTGDPKYKPIVDKNGCRVEVTLKEVQIYDTNGKLLKTQSIIDYTKENILGEYASLDNFIRVWSEEEKKEKIKELLGENGIDLDLVKKEQNMMDVDDFDFICHVAFDKPPLTRKERAENVKKEDFFSKYSGIAREVLETLLDMYMNEGIYELERLEVLRLDKFHQYGKPQRITQAFGGKDNYLKAVHELEKAIYNEVA